MPDLYFSNRTQTTTTTTGTGTIDLGAATAGHLAFSDIFGDGDSTFYLIEDNSNNWEIGYGTYTAGSPDTLSRNVHQSSNSDALVSFGAGTKTVSVVAPSHLHNVFRTTIPTSWYESMAGTLSATNTDLSFVAGFQCSIDANAEKAAAMGYAATARLPGCHYYSAGNSSQKIIGYAAATTTDATPAVMKLFGSANIVLPASTTWHFEAAITAKQTGGGSGTVGDSWSHTIRGVIKRDGAGTTTLVGTPYNDTNLQFEDAAAAAWAVAATANDTNESLDLTVTGEASKNITWVAAITITEV